MEFQGDELTSQGLRSYWALNRAYPSRRDCGAWLTGGVRCAPFLWEKRLLEDGKTLEQNRKPIPLLRNLIPLLIPQEIC